MFRQNFAMILAFVAVIFCAGKIVTNDLNSEGSCYDVAEKLAKKNNKVIKQQVAEVIQDGVITRSECKYLDKFELKYYEHLMRNQKVSKLKNLVEKEVSQ